MDTTSKYILMCSKAEEVQEGWVLTEGDCVAYPPDKITPKWHIEWFNYNDADAWETEELKKEHNAIWLPLQHQLQEMIADKYCLHDMILYFLDFVAEHAGCHPHEFPSDMMFDSYEQLLLAFVYHEKYQKQWDEEKEEWITKPTT